MCAILGSYALKRKMLFKLRFPVCYTYLPLLLVTAGAVLETGEGSHVSLGRRAGSGWDGLFFSQSGEFRAFSGLS